MAYGIDYNDAGDNGGPDSSEFYNDPKDGRVWDPTSQSWIWPAGHETDGPAPAPGGDRDDPDTGGGLLPPAATPAPAPGVNTAPTGPQTPVFDQPFTPPAAQPIPTLGGSTATIPGAPPIPQLPKFMAPTLEQAMNEPGYQFGEQQGSHELQNWLAAHGTFNDSSAADALQDYGRNAAQTQYSNVWNRAYQGYQSDLNSQYLAPFQMAFNNWQTGTVNPTTTNFTTMVPNIEHSNDMNWQNAYNTWAQNWNIFKDKRDSSLTDPTFNKALQLA